MHALTTCIHFLVVAILCYLPKQFVLDKPGTQKSYTSITNSWIRLWLASSITLLWTKIFSTYLPTVRGLQSSDSCCWTLNMHNNQRPFVYYLILFSFQRFKFALYFYLDCVYAPNESCIAKANTKSVVDAQCCLDHLIYVTLQYKYCVTSHNNN